MKTAISVALIVSLSLLVQSLPVSKRNGESTGDSQQDEPSNASNVNESGYRYLLDLFNSISNGSITDPLASQANTIRSLQNVAPVPGCNVFNFSLSGIGQSELAIISQLHLYMERKEPIQDLLTVEVKKFKQGDDGDDGDGTIISKQILPLKETGWLHFPVQAYLSELLPTGKKHAVVSVDIKGANGTRLDCNNSPISFIYSQSELDRAPYLTLHSYDNRISEIDYKTVLKQLETEKVDSPVVDRERRSEEVVVDQTRQACQLNDLNIESHHIQLPEDMRDSEIINPPMVNLGICGGKCTNTSPKHGELKQHSLLSHYYLASNGFQYQGGRVSQCCAPVAYKMETFMLQGPGTKIRIVNLPNIQIAKCDCLHTIDFTSSET